jgi:uncharacterized membrane protein
VTHLRLTPDAPAALSRELRTGTGGHLAQRRGVVALALVASGAMGLIGLYQMGIIPHLPEPPLPVFDSDRIDASPQAYSHLSTPDALLGLGSYAATAALAAMGGAERARSAPWLPLALAAKLAFDVGQGVRLTIQQWSGYRRFCFWCLVAATSSFAAAPLVVPEARAAARALLGRDG